MADACVYLMERGVRDGLYNIGCGVDVTIRELTEIIIEVVQFRGSLSFDATKPDGTPRKLLDVSRLTDMGWKARIALREGIASTYNAFRQGK